MPKSIEEIEKLFKGNVQIDNARLLAHIELAKLKEQKRIADSLEKISRCTNQDIFLTQTFKP